MRTGKSVAVGLLLALGIASLALGALASVIADSLFDAATFGQKAAASLLDPGVKAFAADLVTNAVVESSPDLVAVRPLIFAIADSLVSTRPFRALVERAARQAHQAVFSEGARSLIVSLPDVEILLRGALEHASPGLSEKIPRGIEAIVAPLEIGPLAERIVELSRLGRQLRWLARSLPAAGLVLLLLAIWLAADRRRALRNVGLALLVAGLALWALLPACRIPASVLADSVRERELLHGLWWTFLGELNSWGLFFVGLGVVCAAGATSLLETVDPVSRLRELGRRLIVPPASRGGRSAWALVLTASGVVAATFPDAILSGAVVVAGVSAAYVGIRELFRLLEEGVAAQAAARKRPARRWATRAVVGFSLTALLAAAWIVWRRPGATPLPPVPAACNGYPELCGRRVDEVVFAGSHNAMSSKAVADWMFPHQEAAIAVQLRDGIRALLIDVHYGFPGAARIRTDLKDDEMIAKLKQAVGREGFEAAMRLRDRLAGAHHGERRLYLCHGFCELGAYEFEVALRNIRAFLVSHPDEVLLMVIEDYVSPQDLAAAVERTRLSDFVFRGSPEPQWPTLGELIAADQRLIVFLESGAPGVHWLLPAFDYIQETPFRSHNPDEFSCLPYRGGTRGSLFLLNHWIETPPAPRPSNAAIVNARDFLLARALQCAEQRGKRPNIVAVDFYRTGDLFRVVAELNGVSGVHLR
jgi:hypothetical protein